MAELMKRRAIRKDELLTIHNTQFSHRHKFTMFEMKQRIRDFGHCQCGCKQKFDIYNPPEYDHVTENSLLFDGDETVWQVLRSGCHRKKTKSRAPVLAKVRRVSRKHGIDRETNPIPEKKGNRKIANRGFQPKPEGYKYRWGK